MAFSWVSEEVLLRVGRGVQKLQGGSEGSSRFRETQGAEDLPRERKTAETRSHGKEEEKRIPTSDRIFPADGCFRRQKPVWPSGMVLSFLFGFFSSPRLRVSAVYFFHFPPTPFTNDFLGRKAWPPPWSRFPRGSKEDTQRTRNPEAPRKGRGPGRKTGPAGARPCSGPAGGSSPRRGGLPPKGSSTGGPRRLRRWERTQRGAAQPWGRRRTPSPSPNIARSPMPGGPSRTNCPGTVFRFFRFFFNPRLRCIPGS